MGAFKKGSGEDLIDSFQRFEILLGTSLFIYLFVVVIAALLAFRKEKIKTQGLIWRVCRAFAFVLVMSVLLGVWK